MSSAGVLLKPLRVKRDITAGRRRESRQTAGASRKRKDAGWREYVFHAAGKKP
nr:hypothetical protein [Klebsiella pneumoniae subsp. pneumoniae]